MPQTLFTLIILFTMSSCTENLTHLVPPKAPIKLHTFTEFGETREDPYYWLKERDNPEVLAYLQAENAYTDKMMQPYTSLQKDLYKALRARVKEKDESVPVWDNGYYYYTRTEEGGNYYKLCRKKGSLAASEEVILDVDDLATGHTYFSVAGLTVSPDNQWAVYGVDTVSRRQYEVYVKNLVTGVVQAMGIQNTSADYEWMGDNKRFLYVANNPTTLLTEKVKLHEVGTDATQDKTLYEEKDERNYLGLYKSLSGKYIFMASAATLSSEVWYMDALQGKGILQQFAPRRENILYDVAHQDDRFIIRTNWKSKNFRVMQCAQNATHYNHWRSFIENPHQILLEHIAVFKNYIVLSERDTTGLTQIRIHYNDGREDYIPFTEKNYVASLGENNTYDTTILRYTYTSMVQPFMWYDYDIKTKKSTLLKQKEVPNYDAKEYVTQRFTVLVRDGAMVPISLVYKKGMPIGERPLPLLLYGYGAYGLVMDPVFSVTRTVLLDRGFVFAIAHIRGGEDLGRDWYEKGKLLHKKNTFYDFVDVAQFLLKHNYTTAEHLYAEGGSAGGLLMGAVANIAPELFKGIIAKVPFVDVLTTMQDESIPLTTNEYDEWGNPKEATFYRYIKTYSPYDNVSAKNYPNMLVKTGFHDSQVQYWEPAKWVAKLRAMKTDTHRLLFKINMQAGHGGASGRFAYLEEIAFDYAFLLGLEGVQ